MLRRTPAASQGRTRRGVGDDDDEWQAAKLRQVLSFDTVAPHVATLAVIEISVEDVKRTTPKRNVASKRAEEWICDLRSVGPPRKSSVRWIDLHQRHHFLRPPIGGDAKQAGVAAAGKLHQADARLKGECCADVRGVQIDDNDLIYWTAGRVIGPSRSCIKVFVALQIDGNS